MTVEEILLTLETNLNPIELNPIQELVLCQVWEGKTYAQIAEKTGYNPDYIKSVGSHLWQWFSKILGEPVTKRNFRYVIKRRLRQIQGKIPLSQTIASHPQAWVESLPPCFFGRTEELATLKKWIVQDQCNLVSVVGVEGVGKTALTVHFTEQIQGQFEFVIWRSLHNVPLIDDLLVDWLQVLSQGQEINLPKDTNGKISVLISYLQKHRCLLVIDHYQPMLRGGKESEADYSSVYSRHSSSSDQGYAQLLRRIGEEQHQSCLLLTMRETTLELASKEKDNSLIRSLRLKGLGLAEAREILRLAGLSSSDSVCNQLIERYARNPLALKMIATVIQELFNRDIAQFLAQDAFISGKFGNAVDKPLTHLPTFDMAG